MNKALFYFSGFFLQNKMNLLWKFIILDNVFFLKSENVKAYIFHFQLGLNHEIEGNYRLIAPAMKPPYKND